MNWETCHFDATGMPVFDEPTGDDPRKRVERGGVDTRAWLLRPQPNDPVYATEDLDWVRGTEANGINKFVLGEPGVRDTSAGPQLTDHTVSPLGGGLRSPPEPKQEGPKRLRSESEDKAPDPKAARTAGAQREASRAADPLLRRGLLRAKTPPPAAPAKAEAHAKANFGQEVAAMSDEQLLDTYVQHKAKGAGKKDPEMPNPSTETI